MTFTEQAEQERDGRLLHWTREGYDSEAEDTAKHEDQVWWGYWRQVGGEDCQAPDALFPTEKEAEAFAILVGTLHDFHVGPVVLCIEARDNFEVPL